MPCLSICVSVYNVRDFVTECIESIEAQVGDAEIIVVDDGSTDGSGEVCDRLAEIYDNIRLIHKANGGVSSARNAAIAAARGKWITFVDGDDMLAPNAFSIMSEYFNSDAEIAAFAFEEIKRGEKAKRLNDNYSVKGFSGKETDIYLAENFNHTLWADKNFSHVCGKLFKKSLIDEKGILFDEHIDYGEDTLFSFCCESLAKSIIADTRTVYLVVGRNDSATDRFCENIAEKYNDFVLSIKEEAVKSGKWSNSRIAQAFYCHLIYVIKMALRLGAYHPNCKWSREKRLEWLKELWELDWVKETAGFNGFNGLISKENKWIVERMKNGEFKMIDRRLRIKRLRWIILRKLYSTRLGTRLLVFIKSVKEQLKGFWETDYGRK